MPGRYTASGELRVGASLCLRTAYMLALRQVLPGTCPLPGACQGWELNGMRGSCS